jgi:hypothetical protein
LMTDAIGDELTVSPPLPAVLAGANPR